MAGLLLMVFSIAISNVGWAESPKPPANSPPAPAPVAPPTTTNPIVDLNWKVMVDVNCENQRRDNERLNAIITRELPDDCFAPQ